MKAQNLSLRSSDHHQAPIRVLLFITGILIALITILAWTGTRGHVAAMQYSAMILAAIVFINILAMIMIRLGRIVPGIRLFIAALLIGLPPLSLLAQGYGWIIVLSLPLAIAFISSRTSSLPIENRTWVTILGIMAGIAALMLDIYGASSRPVILYLNIIIPAILAILALAIFILFRTQFPSYDLRSKMLILVLMVTLIPLSLLAYLNIQATRRALIAEANLSLSAVARQTGQQIDAFFQDNTRLIESEAQVPAFRQILSLPAGQDAGLKSDVLEILRLLSSRNLNATQSSYVLMDRQGQTIVEYPVTNTSAPFLGLGNILADQLRTVMLTGTSYISPPLFNTDSGIASIYFISQVTTDTGTPLGALIVRYDASILQDLLVAQNDLAGPDSFGVLFDEHHIHLAHGTDAETLYKSTAILDASLLADLQATHRLPDRAPEQLTTNLPDLEQSLAASMDQPAFTAQDVATGQSINQVYTYRLETRPWIMAFFQPRDTFLAQVDRQTNNTILLVLSLGAMIAFAAMAAANTLGAPIANLTELVEHIGRGDLDIEIPSTTNDEIGRLATTFNRMTSQIRSLLGGLELQVAERTQELELQTQQLQVAAEIARDASAIEDLDILLNRAVALINERFGFYHAGIFLIDERDEYAVLRAANSQGGKRMLDSGHKLKVGQVGIVGDATSTGRPHIASDVGVDEAHFAHDYLPQTLSEIALPLKVQDKIIGALDVQSKKANAFDERDITVLQLMADQLAVAIRNSQLLTEVRKGAHDTQMALGLHTKAAWQEWSQTTQSASGFRYRGAGTESFETLSHDASQALETGRLVLKSSDAQDDKLSSLAVPIQLRNETLGVIHLRMEHAEIPPDISALVEEVTKRLALNLDNARLLEATQRQASRERLTSEIATRMHETLDPDTVLRTAIQEMGARLKISDIEIRMGLGKTENPIPTDNQSDNETSAS